MILFDRVTKSYPRTTRPALDDISLEVERGEFAFVVGQSGSGKSTLLRLALREEVATSGRVLVAGRDLARLPERKVPILRREIGVVFQDFRLLPGKSVYQNVAFALQVIGTARSTIRQTVPETLAMVGLEGKEKRLPHELSGGEQQRVAIARAVVNKPAILLCDEPTGNLDPATSLDIVALLERINRSGTTIVMATHDDEIVNSFRKRVVELQLGRVQRDQHDGGYGVTGSVLPVVTARRPQGHLGAWVDPDTAPPARGAEEGDDDLVAVAAALAATQGEVAATRPSRRRLSLRRS
ncbi:MAG: cell division ATP-binding protein FtsE [Actinomycetota bacterium]|nr:cell division ATP-binding protein FtsE [Actinomycetota bacterium]